MGCCVDRRPQGRRRRNVKRLVPLVAFVALVSACSDLVATDPAPDPPASGPMIATPDPAPPGAGRSALVDFVQDGDSAIVIADGTEERVRLIGINTPERDECYGTESRDLLKGLIEGEDVLLVTDIEATDRFGRILAYVYMDDLLVNAELVRQGAAIARPFEPNTTLQDHLEESEAFAKASAAGMWSPATCGGDENPAVRVVEVNADAPGRDDENRNGEWVVVRSESEEPVDMSGWGLKDESSAHRYTFPDGTIIEPGEELVIYTGCGDDDPPDLYWCDDTPVWDNAGDTAFLTDATGQVRHLFGY